VCQSSEVKYFKEKCYKVIPTSNSFFLRFFCLFAQEHLYSLLGLGNSSDTHIGLTQPWTGKHLFYKNIETTNVCFPVISLHHLRG